MFTLLRRYPGTASLLILSVICLLQGCSVYSPAENSTELEAVQIKEYSGERLSSINDFHENSIRGAQQVNSRQYKLKIAGLAAQPLSYTYDEVIAKYKGYQKLVTLDCVEGWSVKILWEGLLVMDLLNEAGILPSANTVIFHAYDGYTTSLPLKYVLDNNILLAHKMNGVAIPPARGYPFQLVAEQKWGYKWIKWVTEIELSDDVNYKGYWEKAGYSNDASLDKPFSDR
jgi:DMSO/TMAO reductase YedYZ molybdopterin-dependent catalytic subunit